MVYTKKVNFKTKTNRVLAKKTNYTRKANTKKIAAQVAKTVVHRMAENKRLTLDYQDLALGTTSLYYINPLQHVAKGTNEDQRVGDVMTNVRLQLAISYFHTGTSFAGTKLWDGSKLRILVIKSHKRNTTLGNQWTATPPTGGNFNGLFSNNFHGSFAPVNLHDFTLLADKTLSSHTNTTNLNYGVPSTMRFNIPLCKRWQYLDNDVYGKFNNIYVIITASNIDGSTTDTIGKIQCSGYLTWEDI